MGYKIPTGTKVEPTRALMLANADDVPLQVLASHGPTTQFKLLMGLTSSQRDKLSSAYVMDSLFIMDFAPGGTNIPHNHGSEEEIYLLLRGSGEMVAGLDADRKEVRHPVTAGAASSSRGRKSATTVTPGGGAGARPHTGGALPVAGRHTSWRSLVSCAI